MMGEVLLWLFGRSLLAGLRFVLVCVAAVIFAFAVVALLAWLVGNWS